MRTCRGITAVTQRRLNGAGAFEGTRHAFKGQLAADLFGAQPTTLMERRNGLHQRRGLHVKTVTQNMNRGAAPGAGQFNAVYQLHVQRLSRCAGLIKALKSVVIGQGQDSHTFLVRTRHQNRRRQSAVRRCAMAMQVNFHGNLITSS